MPPQELPDDIWLFLAYWCDGTDSKAMACTCQQFRRVFRRGQHIVMVATWARIQSGVFGWLERYVSGHTGGCVDGPPMGSLTIVLPETPIVSQWQHCRLYQHCRRLCPHTDQTPFLCAVRSAVAAAIPDLNLVIGAPLSLSLLADALQLFTGDGLSLDLSNHTMDHRLPGGGIIAIVRSNWSTQHLLALHDVQPLWAIVVRCSRLQLKLDATGATDSVVLGMAAAIEASLLTNQPVAWRSVTLGLANNSITDEGLTAMIQSLGQCPRLVQLTLDLTENQNIRHPEKLKRIAGVLAHIPEIHVTLDTRFCYIPLSGTSDDHNLSNVRTFGLSVMRHEIHPNALPIPHQLVHLCLNISQTHLVGVDGDSEMGFDRVGRALRATAATLQTLTLDMAHMNFMDATFAYFCSLGLLPLIHLRRMSLDVACNRLTNVGVDALQQTLSASVDYLKWNVGFNTTVQEVSLCAAQGLHTVILEMCVLGKLYALVFSICMTHIV
jgi:hypothetical protein